MSDPQGIIRFTDIEHVLGGTVAFDSRGISPSTFLLAIAPQQNLAIDDGTLTIEFGGTVCQLHGCAVIGHSRDTLGGANIYRVRIVDRRWRWSYGQISGEYNVRRDNNQQNFVLGTARNPQQLASLCLDAMGEQGYDVSQLPNVARPYIHWDREIPAEALSQLVESLGCRVVLNPYTDRVKIERAGVGQSLDTVDAMADSQGVARNPRPTRLLVSTGEIELQMDLPLEPVGLEADGRIVHLDSLSYRPNSPKDVDWEHFQNIAAANGRTAAIAARQSVGRWYRVQVPFSTVTYGAIDHLSTIRLSDTLIEVIRGKDGNWERAPAFAYGVWTPFKRESVNRMNALRRIGAAPIERSSPLSHLFEQQISQADREKIVGAPLTISSALRGKDPTVRTWRDYPATGITYAIDREACIIRFSEPILRLDTIGDDEQKYYLPAQLVLRCAFTIRRGATRDPIRWELPRNLGGIGGDLVFARHDIQPARIAEQDPDNLSVQGWIDNLSFVAQQGSHYLDRLEGRFQPSESRTITYAGFKQVEPDGARSIIAWELGERGATTTVSYNDEQPRLLYTYQQRRQMERMAEAMRKSSTPLGDVQGVGL